MRKRTHAWLNEAEVRGVFLQAIAQGKSRIDALKHIKLPKSTFYDWMEKLPEFRLQVVATEKAYREGRVREIDFEWQALVAREMAKQELQKIINGQRQPGQVHNSAMEVAQFVLREGHGNEMNCNTCGVSTIDMRQCESCRKADLLRRYDLTPEQLDAILDRQGNSCGICKESFDGVRAPKRVIDHCHDTGNVRGALCTGCNTKLDWALEYREEIDAYIEAYFASIVSPPVEETFDGGPQILGADPEDLVSYYPEETHERKISAN